jgi:hypothetical protein
MTKKILVLLHLNPIRSYISPSSSSTDLHPLVEYYRGAAFMDLGGYKALLRSIKTNPPPQELVRLRLRGRALGWGQRHGA